MDAYVYQAALYCAACGEAIRTRILDSTGPELCIREIAKERNCSLHCAMQYESHYDSDAFPKGPYSSGGGEADTPQHCDACHVHLENPLTDEGRRYVAERVKDLEPEALDNPKTNEERVVSTWRDYYEDELADA